MVDEIRAIQRSYLGDICFSGGGLSGLHFCKGYRSKEIDGNKFGRL